METFIQCDLLIFFALFKKGNERWLLNDLSLKWLSSFYQVPFFHKIMFEAWHRLLIFCSVECVKISPFGNCEFRVSEAWYVSSCCGNFYKQDHGFDPPHGSHQLPGLAL